MTDMMVHDNNGEMVVRPSTGMVARQDFGSHELARTADVGSSALAAQAEAEVKARYVMALQRPRNMMDARSKLLTICADPVFADVAIYRKPIGGGKPPVEGLSIRFAESALRAVGNIMLSKGTVVYDDAEKRILRVTGTDLEANITESVDVIIEKTVERKFLKEGQRALKTRMNSYGELVHLVPAGEGELLTKQKAEVSKAKREVLLGLIPGDILDECKRRIRKTQEDRDASDPKAALKTICDVFAVIGIRPSDLDQYLGHSTEAASPSEIAELRAVYVAAKDGEATWPEIMAAKHGVGEKGDSKAKDLRDKIAAATEKQKAKGRAPAKANGAPVVAKPVIVTDEQRAAAIDAGTEERQPGED
jgi:hypothetical protein